MLDPDEPEPLLSQRDIERVQRRRRMARLARAGLTQTQTAELLGTSRASVARYEKRSGTRFRRGRPGQAEPRDSAAARLIAMAELQPVDAGDYREAIQEMKPMEAVNALLGLLDGLTLKLPEMSLEPLPGLRLTRQQARILYHLDRRRGRLVPYESIMHALYQLEPEDSWPQVKIVSVYLMQIRARIREAGIEGMRIETVPGAGLRLHLAPGTELDWSG